MKLINLIEDSPRDNFTLMMESAKRSHSMRHEMIAAIHEDLAGLSGLTEEERQTKGLKILPALAWAMMKGAKGIFWVITHPFQAVALAAVATHPQGAWNLANLTWNLIADPGAVASVLANQLTPWGDKKKAAEDLSSIVGGNLPTDAIMGLATIAVQYALPVAAVIALLYGGNKLYKYLKEKNALPEPETKEKAVPVKEGDQGYHVKNNSVYGKVLAFNGQTVIADQAKASELADKYNGSLVKSMDGRRYIIKLSEAPPELVRETDRTPRYDPELVRLKKFASVHYPTLDPDTALDKYMQRSLKHSEEDDRRQDDEIAAIALQVSNLEQSVNQLKKQHAKMQQPRSIGYGQST